MITKEQQIKDLEARYSRCRWSALRAERKGNTRGAIRFTGMMAQHREALRLLQSRLEKLPSNRARELVHARYQIIKTRFVGTVAGHHRFLCELTGFIYSVDVHFGRISVFDGEAIIDDIANGTMIDIDDDAMEHAL